MIQAVDLSMGPFRVDADVVPIVQAQRDANCARGLPSVRKMGVRDARVAIVGYGPSLAETWERIRAPGGEFDAVWTTSRAHDFLIERGLVPTFHTDTDYRAHKVGYNSRFNSDVHYLMATQVHPTYLDALDSFIVSLFHVVQPNGGTFDNRYLREKGTFDAGLQAAQLAYNLGYRIQHWFGMDASLKDGKTHAGPHNGLKPEPLDVYFAGREWPMSTMLVRQALAAEKMLRETPKMSVTIHGDGALRPFLKERERCNVSGFR